MGCAVCGARRPMIRSQPLRWPSVVERHADWDLSFRYGRGCDRYSIEQCQAVGVPVGPEEFVEIPRACIRAELHALFVFLSARNCSRIAYALNSTPFLAARSMTLAFTSRTRLLDLVRAVSVRISGCRLAQDFPQRGRSTPHSAS